MKHLIEHLLTNNFEEIHKKSLINCHAKGLHSIMLLESPGKTIRLFYSEENSELISNTPSSFDQNNMSIAFHKHHCNVTLQVVKGDIINWIVKKDLNGSLETKEWIYNSGISESISFTEVKEKVMLTTEKVDFLREGGIKIMKAGDIHTVGVLPNKAAAWLVFEGLENDKYESNCWSNKKDLNTTDFSELYKKPTYQQIFKILRLSNLY